MAEAGERSGEAPLGGGRGARPLGRLAALIRLVGPWLALAVGFLLIPLKIAELFSERSWQFDLAAMSATIQQIDGAGWISIALIVVEGLGAGAIFMFAVSYSLTFQQNIGKIGDDIINVISSAPPPVVAPPADSITVDAVSKNWIDSVLQRASEQARRDSSALVQQLHDTEAELETARQDLETERAAAAKMVAQITLLEESLRNTSGENARNKSIVDQLAPLIRDMKELGEEAVTRLGESPTRPDDQPEAPTS